jgi:phage FluMu protein Com
MRCEGCDAKFDRAALPVILDYGKFTIECPMCKFVTPLYIKGDRVETMIEHERKLNSWKKGAKNDQKTILRP